MNRLQIERRKADGKEIAERFRIFRVEKTWSVPSTRSGRKRYEVRLDPTNASCTCQDHAETGEKCKHIYAVEHFLCGQPRPEATLVVTDRPKRPTYPRIWSCYNAAQINEEEEFWPLLLNLCRTIPVPEHRRGRPR